MEKELIYIGYRHFPTENVVEQIVFLFLNTSDIENRWNNVKVQTSQDSHFATAYTDDRIGIIVSEAFNFIYLFFVNPNLSGNEYLVGVWSGSSLLSGNTCESGRVLFTKSRDNLFLDPIYIDLSKFPIEDFVTDIDALYLIRKFFFHSNNSASTFFTSKSDEVYNLIRELSENLEKDMEEIRDITSQLSRGLYEVKRSILESGKSDLSEMLDLKIQVAEGNLLDVFETIQQFIIQTNDKNLLNEFLLAYSSNQRIEDQYSKGLVSFPDFNIEKNRINNNLLTILDRLSQSQNS